MKNFAQQHEMRRSNWERLCHAVASGYRTKRQIQAATGISWGSVTNGINDLVTRGILSGSQTIPDNLPMIMPDSLHVRNWYYSFRNDANLSAGIEVRPMAVHGCLMTPDKKILAETTVCGKSPEWNYALSENLQQCFYNLLKEAKLEVGLNSVAVVNLALTGAYDRRKNVWRNSVHMSEIHDWKIIDKKLFPGVREIRCEHDVIAKARAVNQAMSHPENGSFVFVHVGPGVGMIVHEDNRYLEGTRGFAGEIGHVPYQPDSQEVCSCGQKGCLENVLSLRGLNSFALKKYHTELSAEILETHKMDFFEFLRKPLLWLLTTIQNLYDPERILLGGEVLEPFQNVLPQLLQMANELAWQNMTPNIDLYQMKACNTARGAALGGIPLVLQMALRNEN